jgi:mandelate racemase
MVQYQHQEERHIKIQGLRVRPVNPPLRRPLETAGGVMRTAPLVLIDLLTNQQLSGRSYVFCYTPLALQPVVKLLCSLEELILDQLLAPQDIDRRLRSRFRLLGSQGLIGIAVAGIEMAAWDALARASGMALVALLGGEPRAVPAYNGCGLGLIGAERAGAEAAELLGSGFQAIKLRLGYPDVETDLAAALQVRQAVGPQVLIMADYNQCLSAAEAVRRIRRLEEVGLYWVEEPVLAEDYAGHAAVAREVATPIQTGENWWGPQDMSKALAAGASDFVMVDAMKIGGVASWLRAASLAQPGCIPFSSHLFPEISAHLLAVTPTSHWLEYVDWANTIVEEPLTLENGQVKIPSRPGIGLDWDEAAVRHFLYS